MMQGVFCSFYKPNGSYIRLVTEESGGNMLDLVKQNVRICEEFIIGQNIPVVLCFLIILLIFMITNPGIGRAIKVFCVVFTGCGIVWSVLAGIYCLCVRGDESFRYFYESLQFSSYPRSLIVSVGILLIFLGVVCMAFCFSRNKQLLFETMTVCCFSLLPILFTPNQGPRISNIGFWGIVFFTIILFLEIPTSDLHWKRVLYLVSAVAFILSFDRTVLVTRRIYTVQKQREEIFREVRLQQMLGEWNYEDDVMLPSFSGGDLFVEQTTLMGSVHYPFF